MPVSIEPRPLRDVIRDLEYRDVPVSKKLAEEALAAIAADGLVTKDEIDRLEVYGDGEYDWKRQRRDESKSWKQGTDAGRAMLNSLAEAIEQVYRSAERSKKLATVPSAPTFNPWNPWSYWGLGASTKGAPISKDQLLERVREGAVGWLNNSVERLLEKYPKATVQDRTMVVVPKPEVKAAIEQLRRDWVAGNVPDGDLAAGLKPLLDAKYR